MSGETVRGQRDQQHLPTGTRRCFNATRHSQGGEIVTAMSLPR